MKKLILSLAAIALIVTGIFTFAGCEKEESTDIRPVTAADAVEDCPICSETDISLDSLVYVQAHYFLENYGIDIHEFSSNTNFQQLITEINDMTSDIHEFMAISFIASEINGNEGLCYAKQEPPKSSEQQIANCMNQAKISYTWCYTGYVAFAAVGLAGCTGLTFFAALCAAGVIASYAINIGSCYDTYNLRIELCRFKGSY